jgi:hypothetical protein
MQQLIIGRRHKTIKALAPMYDALRSIVDMTNDMNGITWGHYKKAIHDKCLVAMLDADVIASRNLKKNKQ